MKSSLRQLRYTEAMDPKYFFLYCQKLVVFSADKQSVLFARRKDEADFDNYWSLIGGKLEVADGGIVPGIKREKDEEVGSGFRIKVAPNFSCYNVYYQKKNGAHMVLPHYVAVHVSGDVALNPNEYTEHRWVRVGELDNFGPKIDNTGAVVQNALRLLDLLNDDDFVEV